MGSSVRQAECGELIARPLRRHQAALFFGELEGFL
jgi:hypothetical protein